MSVQVVCLNKCEKLYIENECKKVLSACLFISTYNLFTFTAQYIPRIPM